MTELVHDLPDGMVEWIAETGGGEITRLERHVARREAWVVDVTRPDGSVLDEFVPAVATHGFRFEAAEVARALAEGRLETWSMPWAATRRVMRAMDEVRRQVGVVYPGEAVGT